MLHDLLKRDLSGFDIRAVPVTTGLLQQQEEGLSGLDSWFYEILNDGSVPFSNEADPAFSLSEALYKHFQQFQAGAKNYVGQTKLVKYLKTKGCQSKRQSDNRRGLVFPPLGEMRKTWESMYPGTEWEIDEITEWVADPIRLSETGSDYLKRNSIQT